MIKGAYDGLKAHANRSFGILRRERRFGLALLWAAGIYYKQAPFYLGEPRGCTGFDWYGSGYRLQVESDESLQTKV
jgi:hypothetical protein